MNGIHAINAINANAARIARENKESKAVAHPFEGQRQKAVARQEESAAWDREEKRLLG